MRRPSTSTVSGAGPAATSSSGTNVAWNSSTKASISASGTEASAITPMRPPTESTSPSAATRRRKTPAAGASTTLLIFSLSTSTTSSPTSSSAPSSTSHSITVPSVIVRPHFGMPSLEIWRVSLISAPHQNRLSRERRRLCAPGRGRRGPPGSVRRAAGCGARSPSWGRLQVVEAILGDAGDISR